MPGECFVDTNILVCAHDRQAGDKHRTAKDLVIDFWKGDRWPSLSVQVLQGFYVNLQRKGVPAVEARAAVKDYAAWRVVENTVTLLEVGIDEMERWQLSFWDGLILAAARHAGARVIYSEDLSDTQDYGGLRVKNPFA